VHDNVAQQRNDKKKAIYGNTVTGSGAGTDLKASSKPGTFWR
jgi:hypothetical protein